MLKTELVSHATQALGFDLCRVTSPFLTESELEEYSRMVALGTYGDMGYLARHLPFKQDPGLLLPGVQSAIVVIKNYKNTPQKHLEGDRKIARYAAGLDYHQVMTERLLQLEAFLKERLPQAQCYVGVDSRPIAERSLAIKAGIGFRGKNSMVIRPTLGSYFLIGVMLTTVKLESDDILPGTCGTCRRCVDACPVGAIEEDGRFHTTQCISYQTIEHKSALDKATLASFDGWIFGCDICQEACPFNHPNVPMTNWPAFLPESGTGFRLNSGEIPATSAMYRSRKRVQENLKIHTE